MKRKHVYHEKAILVNLSICMVIALIISYVFILSEVKSINTETDSIILKQAQITADNTSGIISGYSRMCEIFAGSDHTKEYEKLDSSTDEDTFTQVGYDLRKEMQNLLSIYGADINMMGAYFINSKSVVTMSRVIPADKTASFFSLYPDLSVELMESLPVAQHWYSHYKTESDPHNWIIYRVQRQGVISAYIIVDFNFDKILNHTSSEGQLVAVGDSTDIHYMNDSLSAYANDFHYSEAYQAAKEHRIISLNKNNYLFFGSDSRIPDSTIMVGVSAQPQQKLSHSIFVIICITTLIVILSILTILYLMDKRILVPVEKLIASTSPKNTVSTSQALGQISRDYNIAQHERSEYLRSRNEMVPLALGHQLANLVSSTDSTQKQLYLNSCLQLAGIAEDSSYCLVALRVDPLHEGLLTGMNDNPNLKSNAGFYHFLLNNIMADIFYQDYPGILAPFHETWYIAIIACTGAESLADLSDRLKQLKNFLSNAFEAEIQSTSFCFGLDSTDFIPSLINVSKEISYLEFWGTAANDEIPEGKDMSFSQYCRMIHRMINRLMAKDYKSLPKMVDEIMDQAIPSGVNDLALTQYRLYTLTALISTSIEEQMQEDLEFTSTLNIANRLYKNTGNIAAFRAELDHILSALIEYKQAVDQIPANVRRIESIRLYIQENIADCNLSVASIAATFQMSTSYLSREFKGSTGINLLEYIQQLRIEKAKQLLPKHSVKDTAQAVGFSDVQALVRAFKKLEGVSPSEYKKINSGEEK